MKQVVLTGIAAALTVSGATHLSSSEANQESSATHNQSSNNQSSNAFDQLASAGQPTQAATVKVGEQQPEVDNSSLNQPMATIKAHPYGGRQATTIYVRNIPVVTFLGQQMNAANTSGVKVATTTSDLSKLANPTTGDITDPVWRAATIAAKLNQLAQAGLDASTIKVVWSSKRQSYLIRTQDQHLIEVVEKNTVLPKTTKDAAKDALQIANRLRYQLGNASPLKEVEGMPKPKVQTIAMGPVRFQIQGWASWYGPGFHGNYTASGERYNQYDLTAAHRHLPFGTRVRVTNLDNGRSVVVRITDRGPFVGDRVLDLSKGAAQVLGTIHSGVSPIRMDVLQ